MATPPCPALSAYKNCIGLENVPLHKILENYTYLIVDTSLKEKSSEVVKKVVTISVHNQIDDKWMKKLAKSLTKKLADSIRNPNLTIPT